MVWLLLKLKVMVVLRECGCMIELIEVIWSRREAQTVDALAVRGEEGRGILRKALGSWKRALIRRCPNGGTRLDES